MIFIWGGMGGGQFRLKFEQNNFEANNNFAGFFNMSNIILFFLEKNKSSEKHKPKPKRANELHFVWGGGYIYVGGGGLNHPKPKPGYVPVADTHTGLFPY